jgi:hypothetical protein
MLANNSSAYLFKVVAKWKEQNKSQDISDLLLCIDFTKMSPVDIAMIVEPSSILVKNDIVSQV